jgi:hypothetical protein
LVLKSVTLGRDLRFAAALRYRFFIFFHFQLTQAAGFS